MGVRFFCEARRNASLATSDVHYPPVLAVKTPKNLAILKQGVPAWNAWAAAHRNEIADLIGVNLGGMDLNGVDFATVEFGAANFRSAKLVSADLSLAYLDGADMRRADLRCADLYKAFLKGTKLRGADLRGASLVRADMTGTDLTRANLEGADLTGAILVETILKDANLSGATIYGVSVWGISGRPKRQADLLITKPEEATIRVDNLEVAQFIYLLLRNDKIREAIDTITSKVVLILGRFSPERRRVLDALRDAARRQNLTPVVFDFDKPASRDLTETIRILASWARFVVADITDAHSIPQELMAIVPGLPSVPVQPLIIKGQKPYGLFESFRRYPWVLREYVYKDLPSLIAALPKKVIAPAERRAQKQTGR